MRFVAKTSYWYTPDIDDNLAQPESKRLKARIIRPDAETREELTTTEVSKDYTKQEVASLRAGKMPGNEEPRKATTVIRRKMDTGRILREFVPDLVNAEVEDIDENGKSTVITMKTGADLASSKAFNVDRLIELLCAEVRRDKLPADTEKNSEQASS